MLKDTTSGNPQAQRTCSRCWKNSKTLS